MGSYVPNTLEERKKMLREIGYSSIEDLFAHIPEEVKLKGKLNIPNGKSEFEVRREMEQIAEKNQVFKTIFRGAGAYRHFIPAMVKNVTSKENLLTAYTPYQAEISQGILQSMFEYQTMICDLTGMDVSNASVYDGATAAAEGVAMCQDRKRHKALISGTVPPYVLEVVETYCFGNGMELEVIPEKDGLTDKEYLKEHIDAQTACVYIQHPNYYGNLEDAQAKLAQTLETCWDEDRFIRGIREDGVIVGAKKAPEANMWLNPQSWSVISGFASKEQADTAMQSVADILDTPYGAKLLEPPYRHHYFDGALMHIFNPDTKENGGIFSQSQGWLILAEALLGHGNAAFRYFTESSPAAMNDKAEIRVMEPYVHGQFTESSASPYAGRAHVHWLTGTASTVMVGCVEGICGMRPDADGLAIRPSIPA